MYGGTPGGIIAAISAAREGASVVLLEQTQHVGGLTTSGVNRDECNHLDRQTLGGLGEQFLDLRVRGDSGVSAGIQGYTGPETPRTERSWLSALLGPGRGPVLFHLRERLPRPLHPSSSSPSTSSPPSLAPPPPPLSQMPKPHASPPPGAAMHPLIHA